jgi:hypothetical protein
MKGGKSKAFEIGINLRDLEPLRERGIRKDAFSID